VVGRDPANWWRSVLVDLGTGDGMGPNYPVVTPEGLVGRIERVGLKQSVVVLVGDPSCQVAALVQETRDHGIITPAMPAAFDGQWVDLTHLTRGNSIQPGCQVVTSGLGGIFPKGIPIGEVMAVQTMDYGLYAEARVRLSASLNGLEEVWIILP
jgi:rod shape-determining protein MreC